ncbi:MAG: hypothetical protein HKM98_02780 [Gammaproteobacteria bacterium]|nr:hypothetical protein [Gammaproteobacteria bacterium]
MLKLIVTLLLVTATHLAGPAANSQERPAVPAPGETFIAPLATQAMLLDGTYVDGLLVVVGEHGIVLTSSDGGVSWDQAQSHTRATLTAVHMHDSNTGWVVGHDAIILRTGDGGKTWETVYSDPEDHRPLFDIWFSDENYGIAVGAYGLFLRTEDGGSNWEAGELIPEPWPDLAQEAEEESDEFDFEDDQYYDFHMNKIVSAETGDLYVAAEAGNFFRSGDNGETWFSMPTTYAGSFFSVLPLQGQSLLLMGMRGNLFASTSGGEAFSQVDLPVSVSLNHGAIVNDKTILIGGMAGALLESVDGGSSFRLLQQDNRKAISALVPVDGAIIVLGETGVRRLTLEQLRQGGAE